MRSQKVFRKRLDNLERSNKAPFIALRPEELAKSRPKEPPAFSRSDYWCDLVGDLNCLRCFGSRLSAAFWQIVVGRPIVGESPETSRQSAPRNAPTAIARRRLEKLNCSKARTEITAAVGFLPKGFAVN